MEGQRVEGVLKPFAVRAQPVAEPAFGVPTKIEDLLGLRDEDLAGGQVVNGIHH
jgi:hypothetical protein